MEFFTQEDDLYGEYSQNEPSDSPTSPGFARALVPIL
jgi:hypothetical protein